jgi:hypothetical protein
VGIRYRAMLQPTELHGLSSAAAATLGDFESAFAAQPRGGVRDANDSTTSSRADHFVRWLDARGITNDDIIHLLRHTSQVVKLIAAFAWDIKQGHGLVKTTNPGPGTVAGYIKAAALWLETEFQQTIQTYSLTSTGASIGLHPLLSDLISSQRTWSKPQKKKEPFTFAIFDQLHASVTAAARHDIQTLLGRTAAVFDWTGLGLHTGSRLGEYGQSKPEKGSPFARVPQGPCQGQALAFIEEDFVYYDVAGHLLTHATTLNKPDSAATFHVTFRYDKSATNHSVRKYTRAPDSFLCPVTRSLSILRRAHTLGIPSGYPLGAFRADDSGAFVFLTGKDIQHVMRDACKAAYPEPTHYMRLNITRLVSHSNRVTAAVALRAAGLSIEDIAHRLRWKAASVETYLRECYQAIGDITQKAITGAANLAAHAA